MPLQFGIWSPICGGWLTTRNYEAKLSTQDLVKLAVQADELGYHFYYIPEHYLNAVHGPNYNVADAWITAALASLNTKNIKIVAAVVLFALAFIVNHNTFDNLRGLGIGFSRRNTT